jgi:hypothetical protein
MNEFWTSYEFGKFGCSIERSYLSVARGAPTDEKVLLLVESVNDSEDMSRSGGEMSDTDRAFGEMIERHDSRA